LRVYITKILESLEVLMEECEGFDVLGGQAFEFVIQLVAGAEEAAIAVECTRWQVEKVASKFFEIRKALALAPELDDFNGVLKLEAHVALNLRVYLVVDALHCEVHEL
jgi:hypothetical protein